MFDPKKDTSDKYCFKKMSLCRRAQPHISSENLMLEMWRGLGRYASECQVISWKQHSTREFRDELRYRVEMMMKSRKSRRVT